MDIGHFYFLSDQYFLDFPDTQLMRNKETINGVQHKRPCFFTYKDDSSGIYWLIPISSQTRKYEMIHRSKVEKYGSCDTIVFGDVLGQNRAFLIQNMCPATDDYIIEEYLDKNTSEPVRINGALESDIRKKASRVLALQRQGKKIIFPNVIEIEKELINRLKCGD